MSYINDLFLSCVHFVASTVTITYLEHAKFHEIVKLCLN